jgi:hypothetical protein
MDYRIAWVFVRASVFVLWSFPLHRDYVFAGPGATPPPLLPPGTLARPAAK